MKTHARTLHREPAGSATALRPGLEALLAKERTRLACEIHDGLTQAVAAAILELEVLEQVIERDPAEAARMLSTARAEIRDSMTDLRNLLFGLQSDGSEEPEIPLTAYVHDVAGRWRIGAEVSVSGDLSRAPDDIRSAVYLVVREGMANAAKHSGSKKVSVDVRVNPHEALVRVKDPGCGLRGEAQDSRHFGMRMMERRVAEAQGALEIDSSPTAGTCVTARFPITEVAP